jgi:hypothetical protein
VSDLRAASFIPRQEIAAMKSFLAVIVVAAIAVVGVGIWQGWFGFKTTKDDGKVHMDLSVNKDKFKQDKEKFKAEVAGALKSMKDKLASLRAKSKGLKGKDQDKASREIDELSKKHESLEARAKELEEAGEEKFEELKKSLSGTVKEHPPGDG